MTDLDRLIEAVDAGDAPWRDIAAMSYDCGPQIQPWRRTVGEAYNGSLDAAKALHDAMLPGWDYRIETGRRDIKARVSQPHLLTYNDPSSAETPARAWLLAVLRAYRATQETQNDRA